MITISLHLPFGVSGGALVVLNSCGSEYGPVPASFDAQILNLHTVASFNFVSLNVFLVSLYT